MWVVAGLLLCAEVLFANETKVCAGRVGAFEVSVRSVDRDALEFTVRPARDSVATDSISGTRDAWKVEMSEATGVRVYLDDVLFWEASLTSLDAYGRAGAPGTALAWKAKDDERIYGLGERFNGWDQAGKQVEMWIEDAPGQDSGSPSYYVTPVVYSSAGYALCVTDNPEGVFSFNAGQGGMHRYERAGQSFRFYLMAGATLKELVRLRAMLQGPLRGIPDWAWGPWISRNSYETQAEAEEALRGMMARNLPVAAIVQEAWKGSSEEGAFNLFNTNHWPDLPAYFDFCRACDVKNILWQVPIIHPDSPHYKEAAAKGYFVKAPDGSVRHRQAWLKGFANVDFTNPEAVAFWKDLLRPVIRLGVYGFKTDDGEDIHATDVFSDGRRGWQMHNEYAVLYGRAALAALDEEGMDGMLWSRSGSLGIESIPALWAGDQWASWAQMASLIPAGLSTSMSGMPFWGHDIGGYLGDPSPELYIRWVQFGAFSPLMQYHGIAKREPWFFGEEAERAYALLARLRMNFKPLLIELGREAAETGVPIMRPMLMEFPDDLRFLSEDTQYMLGPDLLVAPVLTEGEAGRVVAFPEGGWVHLLGGYAVRGPRACWAPVNLEDAPVFVRQDAVLRLQVEDPAALGTWQKDAPVRDCRFGLDRVRVLDPDIPVSADTGLRVYSVCFSRVEGDETPLAARWYFMDAPSRIVDVPMVETNGIVCLTVAPPAKARLEGRRSVLEVIDKAQDKVVFKAVTCWASPVRILNAPTQASLGGPVRETLELVNDSDRPRQLMALFDVLGRARITPTEQKIELPPHGRADIPFELAPADTPWIEDLVARCRLMGKGGELTRWMRVYTRPLPWRVVGPFPAKEGKAFATRYTPEWFRQAGTAFETTGGVAHWRPVPEDHVIQNNGVDFIALYGEREHAAAYALCRLNSEAAQDVVLHMGSDDTLTVWLNGEEIFAREVYRLAEPDQERIPASLKKGVNELLVKIGQDRNPWRFHCRLTGRDGKPVRGLTDGFDQASQTGVEQTVPARVPSMAWRVTRPYDAYPKVDNGWVLPWDAKVLSGVSSEVAWAPVPAHAIEDNHVDLAACFGEVSNAVVYAATEIEADTPMNTRFHVGSDDGIMIWVNGVCVLEANEPRGFKPGEDVFDVALQAGVNEVVCRISQGKGGWSFQVNVDDLSFRPPKPVMLKAYRP